jgi:tRNA-splicing ligase RtcB (3'-phosphate/5'-hydroxy nucleic acid ligase)
MTMADELEAVARALCLLDGVDPESIIDKPGRPPEPAWCSYRERARQELAAHDAPARTIKPDECND